MFVDKLRWRQDEIIFVVFVSSMRCVCVWWVYKKISVFLLKNLCGSKCGGKSVSVDEEKCRYFHDAGPRDVSTATLCNVNNQHRILCDSQRQFSSHAKISFHSLFGRCGAQWMRHRRWWWMDKRLKSRKCMLGLSTSSSFISSINL